jgi:hypothetical protein
MAQITFPPGVSNDVPPERCPEEDAISATIRAANDYMDALEKVNAFAAAGRQVDCEH